MTRPVLAALLLSCLFVHLAPAQQTVTVRPTPSDELFANPAMGWQTFYRAAKDDPSLGDLPSSVMYQRFYWGEIETEKGLYDWSPIDDAVADATASGQTLAFRVMTTGTDQKKTLFPPYLEKLGCKIHTFRHNDAGPELSSPDFDDPVFLENHLAFLAALGDRYNGRPEICLFDVGSVGLWGEWHMSSTGGVPMPTEENARRIIDASKTAFSKTPIVMQLDDTPGMRYAKSLHVGWRVDCWGDMGGFSDTWCHMRMLYPKSIKDAAVTDLWKTAPVALETCWDMRRWHDEDWDVDYILKWALDHHASFINNKSRPLPPDLLPKIKDFLLKVGHRFRLREVSFPRQVSPAGKLTVSMKWQNLGVAPTYLDFHPAIALLDEKGRIAFTAAFTHHTTREWLPGSIEVTPQADLPADLAPGAYTLMVALTDAAATPAVRLAIEPRRDDLWYEMGKVEVASP